MTEKVQYVVTSEGWHDSFEDVSFLSPFAVKCVHVLFLSTRQLNELKYIRIVEL